MTALAYRSPRKKKMKWVSIIWWQSASSKKKEKKDNNSNDWKNTINNNYWVVYREYKENTGLRILESATQPRKRLYNLTG